jgi:hypothetical protein
MLVASRFALVAFICFEARLSIRGGDPLVALHLLRNNTFVIGLVIALAFYMLSSFYLTFADYLQSGLRYSPLAAGLAMLPLPRASSSARSLPPTSYGGSACER